MSSAITERAARRREIAERLGPDVKRLGKNLAGPLLAGILFVCLWHFPITRSSSKEATGPPWCSPVLHLELSQDASTCSSASLSPRTSAPSRSSLRRRRLSFAPPRSAIDLA